MNDPHFAHSQSGPSPPNTQLYTQGSGIGVSLRHGSINQNTDTANNSTTQTHNSIGSITQQYVVAVYASAGTHTSVQQQVLDQLRTQCDEVMQVYKCQVSYTIAEQQQSQGLGVHQGLGNLTRHEFTVHVCIVGPYLQIVACRAGLLRSNPTQDFVSLKASRSVVLQHHGELKSIVNLKLDELMNATRTRISCVPIAPHAPPSDYNASVTTIEIVGQRDAVDRSRMRCLLLLDELFGLSCTSIELDCEMHPIVAGLQRSYLNLIMHETLTSIYLPTLLTTQSLRPGHPEPAHGRDPYYTTIFITGSNDGIARARDLLFAAIDAKRPKVLTKPVPCLPRKIDWLFMNKKQQVRKIIHDNATYISFPPLGSNSNVLTFYAELPIYMERAIRAIMQLVCEYYISCIQLQNIESTQISQQYLNDLQPHILRISRDSGADIVMQRQFIEVYGLQSQVKQAYQELLCLDMIKNSIRDTKFQVELAIEHRDFINGKKNGKVNKIIKAANCRIVFQDNYNDYNMLIDLYSPVPSRAYMGLKMLQDELPAEVSFYIPEMYHKRIIGVGGKNIQKIMKKYGVYVKFSSAEEYSALGGHYEIEDNVIARTPAKNGESLKDLKLTICDSIKALDLIETKIDIEVPRQLHGLLAGYQGRVVLDIEHSTKVRIAFPDREAGTDVITIEGPISQLEVAKARLNASTPSIFDFDLPFSNAAHQAISSQEFSALVNQLKDEGVLVNIYYPHVLKADIVPELTVFLIHSSLPSLRLDDAKKNIIGFMSRKQQVPLSNVARSGSFANLAPPSATYDTFQHFNRKLIAPSTTAPDSQISTVASNFSLFATKQGSSGSVPNLRQLFDDAPNMPPGLKRSGSEVKPQPSAIGRPRNYSNTNPQKNTQISSVRMLSDSSDFLRHTHLNRQSLTMPDLLSLVDNPSTSISSLIGSGMMITEGSSYGQLSNRTNAVSTGANMMSGGTLPAQIGSPSSVEAAGNNMASISYRWGSNTHLGKSMSSSAVMQQQDLSMGKPSYRGHEAFVPRDSQSQTSPDSQHDDDLSITFDLQIVDTLLGTDTKSNQDFNDIGQVLDQIGHGKYLPHFIEHEIDFQTFKTLEDADLKELGIKALGSRKKILTAINECRMEPGGVHRVTGGDGLSGGNTVQTHNDQRKGQPVEHRDTLSPFASLSRDSRVTEQ
ncbi:hypothetical protein RTP6_006368 [Batrachochytrium dendrobatidis]